MTPDLDEMLKKRSKVYVLNKTNPKGRATVTMFRPDGNPWLLVVPKTWIPVCVTDQVSHDTLNNSDDFRRNIQIGMLKLISVEEANKIMEDPDAQEELKRITMSIHTSVDDDKKPSEVEQFSQSLEGVDNVSLTVKEIMSRDIPPSEQYHILRADEDTFNTEDFKYIAMNGSGKVKEWAERKVQ